MKKEWFIIRVLCLLFFLPVTVISLPQSRGVSTITEKDLRYHMDFLGSKEFRGRETPSAELEIATLYLGNWAKNEGLKPIMKDGSFYQTIPFTVTSVFQPDTKIKILKGRGEQIYYYGKDFGGNFSGSGSYSGDVVFAGLGINDPGTGWDDLKDMDLRSKVVIILDEPRPGNKNAAIFSVSKRLSTIVSEIRDRGASAVLSIVSTEREKKLTSGIKIFDDIFSGSMSTQFDSQKTTFSLTSAPVEINAVTRPLLPFGQAEISHELAASILGMSKSEIDDMYKMIRQGIKVPSKVVSGVRVQLDVETEKYESTSRNVIAFVEGSDPVLKNEYIVICGHLEIAQALLIERPKRSVILAWFTGEEKGLNGSHYFINNCPVPVEKITTCLDLDMIGRNHTDSLFLVGSDLLSSGLDASIRRVNKKSGINFALDYKYSNVNHPQRLYFRSDHYPFIRSGIPSVWIFCGFTPDYHTPGDVPEALNYEKFLKITKLVYLTAYDIGNMKEMLKLDVNPAVTSRGKHNVTETSLFQ
jgi:hypothetical protein